MDVNAPAHQCTITGGISDSNGLACILPDPDLLENPCDQQSTRMKLINVRAAIPEERIVILPQSINAPVNSTRPHCQAVIDYRGHMTR